MPKVVFAQKTAEAALAVVRPHAEVVTVTEGDLDGLKAALADADAIVVGTWVKFDKALIDCAPRLKAISRTGVGVDSVDVAYASKRGILVLNTPTANSISVAEHTVAMVCALAKSLHLLNRRMLSGDWKARRLYLPCDLDGKTLGLIGCGSIGRLAAEKCQRAFNMKTLAYDPYLHEAPYGISLVGSIDCVFAEADFVSLHIPLTADTRHMVGARLLGMMKPAAYLINTSRGGIVDEDALYEALAEKRLAGCALDVFEQEPPDTAHRLFALENVLVTPHTAALTKECTVRVAVCAAQGVADYLQGKTPEFIYNREGVTDYGACSTVV